MRFLTSGWLCLWVLILSSSAFAQDDADEDYPPGLEATYTLGDRSVGRVDPDLEFVWGTGSPDARLPAGPFQAAWKGQILVRVAGKYRMHLYLEGSAAVSVNGKVVVQGASKIAGWLHGAEFPIQFGEQQLEVTFHKTEPAAAIKLFWSSDSFPLEPIQPQLLFHSAGHPEYPLIEKGREFYDAYRCNRCHQRPAEPISAPAPALTSVVTGLNQAWLEKWLSQPHDTAPHARMPAFGFSQAEAKSVATYLLHNSKSVPLEAVAPDVKALGTRAGETSFRALGCLACHTHGKEGADQIYNGGDLTQINQKRSAAWIQTWLKNPKNLNADHRMPILKLSDEERHNLALYLAAGSNVAPAVATPAAPVDKASIEAGRKLVSEARCAACHRIPDLKASVQGIPDLSKSVDETKSCLQATPDRKNWRPAYTVSPEEQAAIVAFLKSRTAPLAEESTFNVGKRLLRQKNCLGCHEREGAKGIVPTAGIMAKLDPELRGQSEALIPPDLTAVGDKLLDAALGEAVSGDQKRVRMPWLRVRMPKFQHTPGEKQALLDYLIGHDRVPTGADPGLTAARTPVVSQDATAAADLKDGHTLLGTKGFSCIACHRLGDYEPRNVAAGTRGSDLKMLGARMRPEFFLRWTRSPLRIIPGMEMPSYDKPVASIAGGKIDRQLQDVWQALNDPKAPPIADPSAVQQVWVVHPGEPARIVRDVFNLGTTEKPAFVPHAFAVGLNNGHNLLFDLNTMSLRQWWQGDFARQLTQGKSWFWEASEPGKLPAAEAPVPDLVLRKKDSSPQSFLPCKGDTGPFGRLVKYRRDGHGVTLEYVLPFETPKGIANITVRESFAPLPPEGASDPKSTGWQRSIVASGVPDGYELLLVQHSATGEKPADATLHPKTGNTKVDLASAYVKLPLRKLEPQAAGPNVQIEERYTSTEPVRQSPPVEQVPLRLPIGKVTSVPGYDGVRLPLATTIMPTAMCFTNDGALAFCSLKGQIYIVRDSDGDGIEDSLQLFEEGLAAPYGIIADGKDLIVSHKPELLRLRDTDGDGRADERTVVASGWGYSDNYHDWTFGIVRDSHKNLYVGLGSDYADPKRPRETTRWRGKVLRIAPTGEVTPFAHALRYPTGLAINSDDQIFATDNQGVANTFNEINHLVEGGRYGVPALVEDPFTGTAKRPAIQVPHPWTRSVNGIFFLPQQTAGGKSQTANPFAGDGIGCEFNLRFLVRFTLQRTGDTYQGAIFPFSLPEAKDPGESFLATVSGAVAPSGDIYIGSIVDSGWLGGQNIGDIVRLRPNGEFPLGIRDIRATPTGFELQFTGPINKQTAANPESYSLSGYTRKWEGAYATPDSGRYQVVVKNVHVADDGRSVILDVDRLQEGYVYEVTCGKIAQDANAELWPATGYYTMNKIPTSASGTK